MQHGIRCAALVRMEQASEAGYAAWLGSIVGTWLVVQPGRVYRIRGPDRSPYTGSTH